MEAQEKLQAIEEWQQNISVHPLTCGNDSKHSPLIGFIEDGEVKLKCVDCDWQQEVPQVVYDSYQVNFEDDEEEFEFRQNVVRKMPKLEFDID